MMTYQSRFGREPWLTPYTDETLKGLPAQGVKHIQLICPGFSADCPKRWKRSKNRTARSSSRPAARSLNISRR